MLVKIISLAIAALGSTSSVSAHGIITEQAIRGVKYMGYQAYSDPYYSVQPACIIRKIPVNGPVTDVSLIDVQCTGYSNGGVVGSAPVPLVASAAPGSTVTFNWNTWPDFHLGPLITYMAKAPCDITEWLPGNA